MSSAQLRLFEGITVPRPYRQLEDCLFDIDILSDDLVVYEENQDSESQKEEQNIVITFNQDAFEKPRKPSEETMRSLYIGNLARELFVFYGGNLSLLAAYETPDDWREGKKNGLRGDFERNSDGIPVMQPYRIREHYPENPPMSIAACRELAARIIDDGKYEGALMLRQKASYNESYKLKVDALCEDYGTRTDAQGKMHEELFTFYLMRLPLFVPIKKKEERETGRQFPSTNYAADNKQIIDSNGPTQKYRNSPYAREPILAWKK